MQSGVEKSAHYFFIRGFVIFLIIGFLFGILQTPALGKVGAQGYPGSFAELIKKAGTSVVNIIAVKVMHTPDQGASPFGMEDPLRDFFERLFGGQLPQEYRQNALGTGFIIDTEGFILTNNHVVEQTEELREEAEEAPPAEVRPYLGIQVQGITPEMAKNYGLPRTSGVIIVEVDNGSPAAEAGLAAGDIIVEIDKQPVKDVKTLNSLLAGVKEGYTILFLIDRGGTTIFVTLNVKK